MSTPANPRSTRTSTLLLLLAILLRPAAARLPHVGRDSGEVATVDLVTALHAQGKRLTLQRSLVFEAIRRSRHHTTAEEIARQIREQHPQIDPSTVYRNLEALEELGLVTHTHLNDRITRWHRADVERHGHLVCRACGSEQEVPMASLEPLAARLRRDQGFEPDLAHSAIVGICRTCRSVPSGR